jgi:hypothetical protein
MKALKDSVRAHGRTASSRWAGYGVAGFLALAFLMGGCGPVQSTSRISDAEVAFERARVVEAHEKAPYEYYTAIYYLHKSKEEWGYSDFEAAYDYARDARQAAEAAILKAKEDPWEGSPVDKAKQDAADDGEDEDEEVTTETGPRGF